MDTEQIIKKVTRQLNIGEDAARRYFDTFVAVISEELQKGNDVSLTGIGEFYIHIQNKISRETDRDMADMGKMLRKVVFTPGGKLKDRVNRW